MKVITYAQFKKLYKDMNKTNKEVRKALKQAGKQEVEVSKVGDDMLIRVRGATE